MKLFNIVACISETTKTELIKDSSLDTIGHYTFVSTIPSKYYNCDVEQLAVNYNGDIAELQIWIDTNNILYSDLDALSKLDCINIFVSRINTDMNYEEIDNIADIETDIKEWLIRTDYTIDIIGNWYDENNMKV